MYVWSSNVLPETWNKAAGLWWYLWTAIHTNSIGTRVEGNLMALNIWSGAYLDRHETTNIHFDPSVEAVEATDLVLRDNVVAGCERIGYHLPGQDCSTATSQLWSNNEVHSCLTGAAIMSEDVPAASTCYVWSGFLLWKNADWGLYVDNSPSQQIKNIVAVENGAGLMTYIIGPHATVHAMEDKRVDVTDSTFVGRYLTVCFLCFNFFLYKEYSWCCSFIHYHYHIHTTSILPKMSQSDKC